jgi:ribosomal protein S18 acetylase RimI-like enzyme
MKHEIKTEEHYNFLKSYFTFNTSLEDYLKSSSQVIVHRGPTQIFGLLSYVIKDNQIKIYYIVVEEEFRRDNFGREMIMYLFNNYPNNTTYNCSIRENNKVSIAFFKTFQFKEVDKARYSNGENKIIMERDGS